MSLLHRTGAAAAAAVADADADAAAVADDLKHDATTQNCFDHMMLRGMLC